MRRQLASCLVLIGFSFLLVGTSKAPVGTATDAPSTSPVPSTSAASPSPTSLAVPSTVGWVVHPLPTWKLHLSLPKGWEVGEYDDNIEIMFNGTDAGEYSYCTLRKAPAGMVQYIHAAKSTMGGLHTTFLLQADDALVAETKNDFGPALEVAACAKAGSRDLCCHMVAPHKASSELARPATDEQGFMVVAVVRSIKATP